MELQDYEMAYKQSAEDPDGWMSSARNLLAASDRLWCSVQVDLSAWQVTPSHDRGHHADVAQIHAPREPSLRHAAVFLMIAGFAVENALKAVRVKQEKAGVTKAKAGAVGISRDLLTHDLLRLAREAGVTLSSPESDLLERLQAYLVWAGRYPVAATARGQAAVQIIWGSDQGVIAKFFARIESIFLAGVGADQDAEPR